MPAVKTRFLELIHKKEQKLGQRLLQKEVIADTGLPKATISRWFHNPVIRHIDDKVAMKLCEYFECDLCDLVYIDWDAPTPYDKDEEPPN